MGIFDQNSLNGTKNREILNISKKKTYGQKWRKIRNENCSSAVIFVLRRSRTFHPLKLLVWTLNYVHKKWFCTKVNIEDFLLLLNAEKAIFTDFPVSFSLRAKTALFSPRLLLYSPYRYPNHTNQNFYQSRKSISNRFVFGYGGFWPRLGGFSGRFGVFLAAFGKFWPLRKKIQESRGHNFKIKDLSPEGLLVVIDPPMLRLGSITNQINRE